MTVDQGTLSEKINATVEAYVDLLSSGTAEQIADLYAANATVEDPIGADLRSTREQLIEFYSVITGMDERTAALNWSRIAGDTAVFEF
ncbi:nuclear transport factor 2 family protein, partial [Gordonia rhizosphera]